MGGDNKIAIGTAEARAFLSKHHPFDLLPGDALDELAAAVKVARITAGEGVMKPGDEVRHLSVVYSGATETHTPEGHLLARTAEGECFGIRSLLRGGTAVNRIDVIEDGALLLIPASLFEKLRADHPPVAYFFAAFDTNRLSGGEGAAVREPSMELLTKPVRALVKRGAISVTTSATIAEAARMMRDERVSSVMVTDDSGALRGIVTDRDLRSRVVAEERPYGDPITAIMSPDPSTVDVDDDAFDALLLMVKRNIHHVPVVEHGKVVGCLTGSALVQSHTTSPLFVARALHECTTVEEMAGVMRRVPELVHQMVDSGATSASIGRIVTSMTDSLTVQLAKKAEAELGPPPVPYLWLAAGSQGRQEQTALSDQDNAMVIDDSYDPAVHGEYFKALAKSVCDGLDACGYIYCPGEMMAMTDQWRQTVSTWREYFTRWIDQPEPKALMLSSVFFDLRPIHGEMSLFDGMHEMILEKTRKNRIFQAHLARNAMSREAPLGFFRNFVLVRGGDHDHTLDLKHNGVVPIVEMARLYALSGGLAAINTPDRLAACAEAKVLSGQGASDLMDALEFIAITRLRHQARRMREGKKADNYLPPDELSAFERNHLKSAFAVVKSMQQSMANTYQLGRF